MISSWGGWDLFQELLAVLQSIALNHRVSVANVAVRWVLQQPAVGAVIIGSRLGLSTNTDDNARVFDFSLDERDLANIAKVLDKSRIGDTDVGDEYR